MTLYDLIEYLVQLFLMPFKFAYIAVDVMVKDAIMAYRQKTEQKKE